MGQSILSIIFGAIEASAAAVLLCVSETPTDSIRAGDAALITRVALEEKERLEFSAAASEYFFSSNLSPRRYDASPVLSDHHGLDSSAGRGGGVPVYAEHAEFMTDDYPFPVAAYNVQASHVDGTL